MLTTDRDNLAAIAEEQRRFFDQGRPRLVKERLVMLARLKQAIQEREAEIINTLQEDVGKSPFETYSNEILAVIQEITHIEAHLSRWARPKKVGVNLITFPAQAQCCPEPLGRVLIISPWNYPFNLALTPLVGAIAAGNCVVLKPSELTPRTSQVLAQLIREVFDPGWVTVVQGDADVSKALLRQPFDHIFFTGSTAVGKQVMAAAAEHLTPVTLELGGKSPCIVTPDINLSLAAKRIMWGKTLNAGQTCVAPDYLLVQETLIPQLIPALRQAIALLWGPDPSQNPDYGRIINDRHFNRLVGLLSQGKIVQGGDFDPQRRYLAPTLIVEPDLNAPLMQEEIFGPLLPILPYRTLPEAIAFVKDRPKPLALYLFSHHKPTQQQILTQTSSGGVGINDVIVQLTIADLPFGGVGSSGMGSYHGKASFDTFSHYKSLLQRPFWGETHLRFPPYGDKLTWIKRLLG